MSSATAGALRWLREVCLDNAGLKLISLAFALGFYAFSNGSQNAQRTFPVSVLVLLPRENQDRVMLTQPPATVRLTVHGGRSTLDELKTEDLGTVQLDLRKGTELYAKFDVSSLNLPPGVRSEVDVDPPGITLLWDDIIVREIPIQVSVTGQALAGYAVQGQPMAEPRMVHAHGPKSLVETIQYARAEPFDISGLGEGIFPRKISIDHPPPRITYDEDSTTVTVEIGRARLERMYAKLPVHVLGIPRGVVTPADVDVKVSGPPEIVAALRAEQILPTVDLHAEEVDTKTPGSTKALVTALIEGCTTQILPNYVVVKW